MHIKIVKATEMVGYQLASTKLWPSSGWTIPDNTQGTLPQIFLAFSNQSITMNICFALKFSSRVSDKTFSLGLNWHKSLAQVIGTSQSQADLFSTAITMFKNLQLHYVFSACARPLTYEQYWLMLTTAAPMWPKSYYNTGYRAPPWKFGVPYRTLLKTCLAIFFKFVLIMLKL